MTLLPSKVKPLLASVVSVPCETPDTLCESGKGFRIGFHPSIVRCCRSTKHLDLVQRIRLEKAGKIDQWRRRQRRRSSCRAVQRSIHDAHGEDCTDAAEGDAMPTI